MHDHLAKLPLRSDPLIDENHAIRRAISEQLGNDVDHLCDYPQQRGEGPCPPDNFAQSGDAKHAPKRTAMILVVILR